MKFRLFYEDGEAVWDELFGRYVEFDTEEQALRAVKFHFEDSGTVLTYKQV